MNTDSHDAPRERPTDPVENWLMKPALEWLEQAEHGENKERCRGIAALLRDLWRQSPSSETRLFGPIPREQLERFVDLAQQAAINAQRDLIDRNVEVANLRGQLAAKQAELDRLMLEYCPDEMTEAQLAEWAKHQKPVKESPLGKRQMPTITTRQSAS